MTNMNRVCQDLGLPVADKYTQDWAHELPDGYRTKEWLSKYVSAYSNESYSLEERYEIMKLSVDVCNDLLLSGVEPKNKIIVILLDLLYEEHNKYMDIIDYWSLDDECLEDCFALTPYIRELKRKF